MKQKIIITNGQYKNVVESFAKLVTEVSDYNLVLGEILADLDKNYELVDVVHRGLDDYREESGIRVKVDDSIITKSQLLSYLKKKHSGKCGDNFLRQVISDWCDGKTKDGSLSTNISLKS